MFLGVLYKYIVLIEFCKNKLAKYVFNFFFFFLEKNVISKTPYF